MCGSEFTLRFPFSQNTTRTSYKKDKNLYAARLVACLLLASLISPRLDAITLRDCGDIIQYTNPFATYLVAVRQHKDIDYLLHLGAVLGAVGACKGLGRHYQWGWMQRPNSGAFTGFPSGHTASSWMGAAYARQLDWRLAVPLYGLACVCGYSRVWCGAHTWWQVVAGVLLSEAVVLISRDIRLEVISGDIILIQWVKRL